MILKPNQLSPDRVPPYVFRGKRFTITILSIRTGNTMVYNFTLKSTPKGDFFYIGTNTKIYIGRMILSDPIRMEYIHPPDERYLAHKSFKWFFDKVLMQPRILDDISYQTFINSQAEFYHSGRCSVCSRKLTDPESLERGMGKQCFQSMY
jgi:hypothetical protein